MPRTMDPAERDAELEALRRREERLRLMISSVKDYAIFLLDPTGHVETWNAGAQAIKGYRAEEIVGSHISRFYTPEDQAAGRPAMLLETAERTGRVEDEGWRVRKDGTWFWADVVITALRDPSGGLAGFTKVTRDLTERRTAAENIRRSEELLRLMISSVKDYAIFMLDPEGRVQTWNSGARAIKQYEAHEIVGQPLSRFHTEEDRSSGKAQRLLAQAARDGRVEDEGWRVRKDGSRFWADVIITALRDPSGRLVGFAKVTRDLTERRLAEARERATAATEGAKERLRFLVDAGTVLSSSLDRRTILAHLAEVLVPTLADWCTVSALREDGSFRREVVLHRDPAKAALVCAYQEQFPPGDHGRPSLNEIMASGNSLVVPKVDLATLEASAQSAAHLEILRGLGVSSCLLVPLRVRGVTVGVVSLMRSAPGADYTEIERALAEHLTARASIALENAQLYRQAQEAVRLRDDFLSIASHELRTPLTTMKLQLQSLLRKLNGHDPALAKAFERANRNASRLGELVDALFDVSRIAAGKLALDLEAFDLAQLLQELGESSKEAAQLAGCELVVHAPASLGFTGDRLRLEQVLRNLLSNAFKYAPGAPVRVSVVSADGRATLSVEDGGPGIADADRERIFGRFERAESARDPGGLGLGLYVASQIVEAHGGSIEAENRREGGARFVIRLPLRAHGAPVQPVRQRQTAEAQARPQH